MQSTCHRVGVSSDTERTTPTPHTTSSLLGTLIRQTRGRFSSLDPPGPTARDLWLATNTLETPYLTLRTGQPMPVAEHICTPLSADLWDNLSPQASLMDVYNPHEACFYSYYGWTDARQPAYECLSFLHGETLNFELMWRRK